MTMFLIQRWREQKGWSRIELATRAHVQVGDVLALESGGFAHVSVEALVMVLAVLGKVPDVDDDLRGLAEWEQ